MGHMIRLALFQYGSIRFPFSQSVNCNLLSDNTFGPNHLALSNSGAMLGFYVYRIAIHRYNKGDNLEQSSENYWP